MSRPLPCFKCTGLSVAVETTRDGSTFTGALRPPAAAPPRDEPPNLLSCRDGDAFGYDSRTPAGLLERASERVHRTSAPSESTTLPDRNASLTPTWTPCRRSSRPGRHTRRQPTGLPTSSTWFGMPVQTLRSPLAIELTKLSLRYPLACAPAGLPSDGALLLAAPPVGGRRPDSVAEPAAGPQAVDQGRDPSHRQQGPPGARPARAVCQEEARQGRARHLVRPAPAERGSARGRG
jgi:hypothetical protein